MFHQMLGKDIAGFAPIALAIAAYMIASTWAKKAQAKQTEALIGKKAPEFSVTFKSDDGTEEKKTIFEVLKENPLPTVVDFYQNF